MVTDEEDFVRADLHGLGLSRLELDRSSRAERVADRVRVSGRDD